MALRNLRTGMGAVAIALAMTSPALAKQPESAAERVTAREAMERQFAAPVTPRPAMSAPEAAAIIKKYHARIGQMLEPKRETSGGRAGR